jgi:TonB-linked SusC/RagA family outer membrane protein
MKLKTTLIFTLFLVSFMQMSFAQKKTVSGTVSDASGVLPGVSVILKNTTTGATSDFDGVYTISAKPGDVLVFRYLGMETIEKTVAQGNTINVLLTESSESLGEVVITGITTTDKRLFTGAASSVKATEIKLAGTPDISRSLEGRSAGVTVQNVSGTFGAAPKIRIRGATSIYGSSRPLWVIDGVIIEDIVEITADDLSSGDASTLISSAIAGLNPEDIDTFDVLKDGSATSIYGARAKGGVIVITTKRGKAGVSRINYSVESTFRTIPSYSDFNVMNSQDQMSVYEEMRRSGWLNPADVSTAASSGVYGKLYNSFYDVDSNGNFAVKNDASGVAEFLRMAEYRNTNWFKQLFDVSLMQNHSISMSSGTEKSTYYGSVSALLDPGWTKASNVNRYTANFNSSYKLSDKLELNTISNVSFRNQKAPGTLAQETDVVTGEVRRDFDINPYSFAINSSRTLDPNQSYIANYTDFNILDELEENYIDLKSTDLRFQAQLKYKPTKKTEISVLGALKYQTSTQEHHSTEFSNQANAYRAGIYPENATIRDANPFLYTDPDDTSATPISVLPEGGIYRKTDYESLGYDLTSTFSYKNVFDNIHTVNFYSGMQLNSIDRSRTNFTGWGLQYSLGEIPFYGYELFKKQVEENSLYYGLNNTKNRGVAFFSNATYSWKRRYTINGTVRYEGTNRLGKSTKSRWLPTWNVSGAWNAHEEDFFDALNPVLSNFTVRASYSLTADSGPFDVTNSAVDIRSVNPWRPSSGVRESGLTIESLENSDLTYEKKNEINIGFDAGFIDNRINVGFDWYTRDNYDLIGIINTQGIGGEATKFGNVASMTSQGLELSISSTNIKTDNFSWKTNFIYSKTTNEVTELENRSRVIDLITGNGFARTGYPVRSIFSIPFEGLNSEGLPTFTNENGETTVSDIYFQERDNIDFLEYSGSADPTDIGGLGNTFTYKGFSLNVFASYSFGNVVRLNPIFNDEYTDLTAFPREFENRWVTPGDENFTDIPRIASARQVDNYGGSELDIAYNAYNYSTARIAKGDFIRLKQVTLGYQFDKSLIEKLKISSLSMSVNATNLFLLYSDKKLNGQDPEFFNSGGVASPLAKQITFSLRLGL